jgi:L-iditol 2-dehydrogenase
VIETLDHRLAIARELGETHAFNPERDDVAGVVADLTGGYGAEFVFECGGTAGTFQERVDLAAPGGAVEAVSIPAEDRLAFRHSCARRKGLDVRMIRRANLTFERALRRNRDEGFASHTRPLDQAQQACETAAGHRDGVLKEIVTP